MFKIKSVLFVLCGCLTVMPVIAEEAIFAMGCFWSADVAFRQEFSDKPLVGIKKITVGYAGGTIENPTYKHHPGYKEAIKIDFDPKRISYDELLNIFWHNIDFFDNSGQFCDRGPSYVAAIYYLNRQQQREAEISKDHLQSKFKEPVVTEILPLTTFHAAEAYHQDYEHKNPVAYKLYRYGCRRDERLQQIWKE